MGDGRDNEEEQTERRRLVAREGLRNVESFGGRLSFIFHIGEGTWKEVLGLKRLKPTL